jgi:5-methylcytosine-specific restriction endonuclease McrA
VCWAVNGSTTAPAAQLWGPSVDDIVPRSKGGAVYDPANLQGVHSACNGWKGAREARLNRLRDRRKGDGSSGLTGSTRHATPAEVRADP